MQRRSRTFLGIGVYLGLMACLSYPAWQEQRPPEPSSPMDYPVPERLDPVEGLPPDPERAMTKPVTRGDGPFGSRLDGALILDRRGSDR